MLRWRNEGFMYERNIRRPKRKSEARFRRFLPRVDWDTVFQGGMRCRF